jgi:hypothetical protein
MKPCKNNFYFTYRENNIIEDLLTLHNCLPFQENAINCKRQEANDKILSINMCNSEYLFSYTRCISFKNETM